MQSSAGQPTKGVEFVNNLKGLMRSDVILEIDNIILIIEMNRINYKFLHELKIR